METSEKQIIKNEKYRKQRGITLISLIVTIIILLILVAVVVDIAVDGKLVDSAQEAVTATNDKVAQQQGQVDSLMDELQNLKPQPCSHTGEWETEAEVTCTTEGKLTRTCEKCEYVETKKIPALGHSYSNGTCKRCSQTCTHTSVTWATTTQVTCEADGVETGTCQICGYAQIRTIVALGHSYTEGICQRCSKPCAHTTVTWTITTPATCTTEGTENGTCQACGQEQIRAIAKAEHTFTSGTCSVCGCELNANTIASSSKKSNYYGKYVTGITLNNGDTDTKWKIFYADANNIYLIAADYINVKSYISSDLVDYGDNNYKAYFTKTIALPAYDGGAEETAIFGEGTVGGTLLKTYLDYLNANSSLAKNNPNMQATAFMLDTTAWSGYTDSNQETKYIDYAIGGPTIEMLRDSYNGYQGTTGMYTPVGANGYYVGNASTTTNFSMSIGTTNSLYVSDTTTSKAQSYWLASPAAGVTGGFLRDVLYSGYVTDYYYSNDYAGFRPLVRLSSAVKLTPSGTDEFTVGY